MMDDDTDDEDVWAPPLDDLDCLARLLWQVVNDERLGPRGRALPKLEEIRRRIEQAPPVGERLLLWYQLWALSSGSLGVGPIITSPDPAHPGRPERSLSTKIDHLLDDLLILRALALAPQKGSIGAALRTAVEEQAERAQREPSRVDRESHIKRLRRRMEDLQLIGKRAGRGLSRN